MRIADVEAGIGGITQIGSIPLYVYGAFSFTESATLAPDIFRSDVRFYGAIEKGYGGFLYAQKGSPISFNISAGRQNFQLNRNFLFGQVLGAANALERGASFLNARTVYDNAVLANLRLGKFLVQGFYLNPNELPIADTKSRFAGVNLKYNDNQNIEAAIAYITIPQSNSTYLFPDGQKLKREGLQVINPRLRLTSLFGVEGLWVESEYAYEWNSNFAMSAHAGYIWTGYTFQDLPWQPSISYRFAAFSGDNPKTDSYERFDFLRGGGLGDWLQGINLAKVYNNSNVFSHRVELKIKPTSTLQFSVDYFYLFADQLNNLGGNPALSSLESRSIGHELMFTTRWSISQNLFLLGVTSIAFPADAIRRAVTEDASPWFTFQVSLFLGF
ncbi:MAG TPA: alginate export family protein [Leptolyngbyaceae cyanobacterium M33_DOE_097]|uniref:Alginate export domain-containing protein n=1 Tax=Oscillatoriales cyanobacterium SpSt-418 TaxID=2282169 RepID=A0A7C3PIF8_9CYAN|nr:alginate export family protein [Leptolyngbyaceae cyanobacterium M33_DOE_097]